MGGPRKRFRRRIHGANHRFASRGFTFLEIMLVVVIIGILAAIVGPRLIGRAGEAKVNATKTQMAAIKTALMSYEMRMDTFPTTSEGLAALVVKPSGADPNQWQKCMDKVPLDAWTRPFQYAFPSDHGMDFDISSAGSDGQHGTPDDITNWETEQPETK